MAHAWDPDRPSGKISQIEALMGAGLALSCLSSGAANAGSSSANLAVYATVQRVCATSTSPLAFGTDVRGVGAATGSPNILVHCSAGVVGYTVAISGGATLGVTRPYSDLITVTITY
jgi:spore coat protein U-like protein